MGKVYVSQNSDAWKTYNQFVSFTAKPGVKGKTVVALNKGQGESADLLKSVSGANAVRSSSPQKEVREKFVTSVCRLFHTDSKNMDKLPPEVRSALNDNVSESKSLSVRQIKAVDAAIKKLSAKIPGVSVEVPEESIRDELESAQDLVTSVFKKTDAYETKVLQQLDKDINRDHKFCEQFGKEDKAKMRANPYIMINKPGQGVTAHLLNGCLYPKVKNDQDSKGQRLIERFINISFLKTIGKSEGGFDLADPATKTILTKGGVDSGKLQYKLRAPKQGASAPYKQGVCVPYEGGDDSGWKAVVVAQTKKSSAGKPVEGDRVALLNENEMKQLELYRAAVSLSHQSAFTFGMRVRSDNLSHEGRVPIYDPTCDRTSTVNVARSPDGSGYDVIVRQNFNSVMGTRAANVPGSAVQYFDPMKPGKVTVSYVYHVGFDEDGEKPVVTFKEKPEVKFDFPKAISEKKFKSQLTKFAKSHMTEIIKAADGGEEWWSRFNKAEKAELQNTAVDTLFRKIKQNEDTSVAASVDRFAKVFAEIAHTVKPTQSTVNAELAEAENQIGTAFDTEVGGDFVNQDNALFKRLADDDSNPSAQRLTADDEEVFANHAAYGVPVKNNDVVRGFLLDGKQPPLVNEGVKSSDVALFANKSLVNGLVAQGRKPMKFSGPEVPIGQLENFPGLSNLETVPEGKIYKLTRDGRGYVYGSWSKKNLNARPKKDDLAALVYMGNREFMPVTKQELALYRAAMAFGRTMSNDRKLLSRIVEGEARKLGGNLRYDKNRRMVCTSNIVPSKTGPGYDIYVHQCTAGITSVGRKEYETVLFNPTKPASLAVDCVYHVEMSGKRPKVTLKKPPQVKLTNVEWGVNEDDFKDGVESFYNANKEKILKGQTMDWFQKLSPNEQEGVLEEAFNQVVADAAGDAVSVAKLRKCLIAAKPNKVHAGN